MSYMSSSSLFKPSSISKLRISEINSKKILRYCNYKIYFQLSIAII
jgi:hypothetical protein